MFSALNDDVESFVFMDDNPQPFADVVKKINDATRKNSMLVSNELASLSNDLFVHSSKIFQQAEISSAQVEIQYGNSNIDAIERSTEAENIELRRLNDECGELYTSWIKQLEKDVSKIRSALDITHEFLGVSH